jgi:Chaperone of endosialidase
MPRRLPIVEGVDKVIQRFDDAARRLTLLEQPDGNQLSRAVATLQQLVTDLPGQIYAVLATAVNTGDVTATGFVHAGTSIDAGTTIDAGGNITTPARVTGATGLSSLGVYNNLLTTSYRSVYVTSTGSSGDLGYVPSSSRFKDDIHPAPDALAAALAIQVVTFRYTQAIVERGDDAQVEWGVIAEDIDALGFHWLVDYDEEGLPFGVKKEALILAFIPVIQNHEARLLAAGL